MRKERKKQRRRIYNEKLTKRAKYTKTHSLYVQCGGKKNSGRWVTSEQVHYVIHSFSLRRYMRMNEKRGKSTWSTYTIHIHRGGEKNNSLVIIIVMLRLMYTYKC